MSDKEQKAIARLREAAFYSESLYNGAPLIVTTSGGKDSDVCLALAQRAGIRFEVMHNHTTADAPETIYHIRNTFRTLEEQGIKCTVNKLIYKGVPVTMWSLIPQKLMPPTRFMRYCCAVLKEKGGAGRMITTGVRWAESTKRRKNRAALETVGKKKEGKILLDDNDDRRLFETCSLKAKRICNPIIDWTDRDIWDYIESEHIETNPLYQCGFHRVGCIGCPMARLKKRSREFARYPKYQRAYIRAFDRMLEERKRRGKMNGSWRSGTTGIEIFHWWMEDGVIAGQVTFDDGETSDYFETE